MLYEEGSMLLELFRRGKYDGLDGDMADVATVDWMTLYCYPLLSLTLANSCL